MKKISVVKTVCAAGLTFACVFGLAACSSGGSGLTGGVAATVNGVEISEDDVTRTVESIRESMGVADAEAWAEWMVSNGYTSEQVREEVIDGFVDQEILRQGAAELGVVVDEAEVESYYNEIASQFDSESAWEEALLSAGYASADEYRETIELSLLSEAVQASLDVEAEPSDEDMLTYAQMYGTYYDGAKKSSHILFDAGDEATAQEVLDKIKSGELDFAAAAQQYSKDTGSAVDGGNVGWDMLTSFVDEYQTGLNALGKGEVSGLVSSDYGIHIIMCTDVFNAPAEITSADQLPAEFVDSIRSMLVSSMQSEAYSNWLIEKREAAEIVINAIPTDVPYYVAPASDDTATEGEQAADGEDVTVEGDGEGTAEGEAEAA